MQGSERYENVGETWDLDKKPQVGIGKYQGKSCKKWGPGFIGVQSS